MVRGWDLYQGRSDRKSLAVFRFSRAVLKAFFWCIGLLLFTPSAFIVWRCRQISLQALWHWLGILGNTFTIIGFAAFLRLVAGGQVCKAYGLLAHFSS